MKGQIKNYGLDSRDHILYFLKTHYNKWASNADLYGKLSPENLGKNWSCYTYERDSKKYLVCFDSDDGGGGTPADCKLNWWKFREVLDEQKIEDYLIFKVQYASVSEQRQYYPFKMDVYPLALMTNHPSKLINIINSLPKREKDIDVLFVGGRVHEQNKPFVWPKNRDLNQWWPGSRKIGYEKLLEIKARRLDLKIETHDKLIEPNQYYDLVNRSKICLDFPGIGLSSRKFYEFLMMGKCILALKQNTSCWPLHENVHYSSLGLNFDYSKLESSIDMLLADSKLRIRIESSTREILPLMMHENVSEYVIRTVDEHIDNLNSNWSIKGRQSYI